MHILEPLVISIVFLFVSLIHMHFNLAGSWSDIQLAPDFYLNRLLEAALIPIWLQKSVAFVWDPAQTILMKC